MSDDEKELKTPRRGTRLRKSTLKAVQFEEVRRKLSETELSDHDDEFSGEEVQIYDTGLLFKDLYWSCREAFLVSSDLALRAQLTEFVDHKMVKIRRSADGAEYLLIPITNSLLQRFLNEQT